jgi:hypothetical protein
VQKYPKGGAMARSIVATTLLYREEAPMADPWIKLDPNETAHDLKGDGARWVITTGFAFALVVLLAVFALRAN